MVTKAYLKKQILNIRNNMAVQDVQKLSGRIIERLLNLEAVKAAKTIFIYNSFKNEVDTSCAIGRLLKSKNVCIPKIDNSDSMAAIKIDGSTKYTQNIYGIWEPAGGREIKKEDIDVCVVPGIVFDIFGGRTGYGKAYYDIFLRGTGIYKAALCYDFQLVDYIPVDLLDVDMDCIITESRTLVFKDSK